MRLTRRAPQRFTADGSSVRGRRRERARALAGLFAAGGTLSGLVVWLPGWDHMHEGAILVTAVMAVLGALILVTWGNRLGALANSAFLLAGTALIASAQALAGGGTASATYAMLYVWVALHASMFFRPWIVAAHLGVTTVVHVAILVSLQEPAIAPQVVMTLGTQIAASVVVGRIAGNLRWLAATDALTGLGNRRAADLALQSALRQSRREADWPTSVALLDLNGFKAVNDRLGHAAGDRILVAAAEAWSRALRPTDSLARTGGDEFMVVMPGCDLEAAREVVGRLVAMPVGVSVSVGLAEWDAVESGSELVARADEELYSAKGHRPGAATTGRRTRRGWQRSGSVQLDLG